MDCMLALHPECFLPITTVRAEIQAQRRSLCKKRKAAAGDTDNTNDDTENQLHVIEVSDETMERVFQTHDDTQRDPTPSGTLCMTIGLVRQ